jgi:hypothetical protein
MEFIAYGMKIKRLQNPSGVLKRLETDEIGRRMKNGKVNSRDEGLN